MGSPASGAVALRTPRPARTAPRVAFVGSERWLANCAPPAQRTAVMRSFSIATDGWAQGGSAAAERLQRAAPGVSVIFDPPSLPRELLEAAPGITLGVLVGGVPSQESAEAVGRLSRLVSFRPGLTGSAVGPSEIWRAVPPPVSDAMFAEPEPIHRRPRAISIGASTDHREAMLVPAKHHHELMHVADGLYGGELARLLGEYEVGVYIPPLDGGGFGAQVGLHLAAGQLLISDALQPAHGLERDIDYVRIESPDALERTLDRMGRFPEMYRAVQIRGRMKAESYRASDLFARLLHDLLGDVRAFGPRRPAHG